MQSALDPRCLCPCCANVLTDPMLLHCNHNVCGTCVNFVYAAGGTDCPVCLEPMGFPILNLALAAYVLAVQSPGTEEEGDLHPLKRHCTEVPPAAVNNSTAFDARAKTIKAHAADYKAQCALQEEMWVLSTDKMREQLFVSSTAAVGVFRKTSAVDIKRLDLEAGAMEVFNLQAGFQGGGVDLPPFVACSPPSLDIKDLQSSLIASWLPKAYVLILSNEDGTVELPPMACLPADIVSCLLRKTWKDPSVPYKIQHKFRTILFDLLNNTSRNMAGTHLYFLLEKGVYDMEEDVLRLNIEAGYDDLGVLHERPQVHTFTMEAVAHYLLNAADDASLYMRLQAKPLVPTAWARPVP